MRQLASVQKICELRPIEGADKICVAMLEGLGWECVVKVGEFAINDLCIYIETDSRLPRYMRVQFSSVAPFFYPHVAKPG